MMNGWHYCCPKISPMNSSLTALPPHPTNAPKSINLSSRLIKMSSIDERIRNVRDVIFLPGFLEPTIAILFATNLTTVNRLEVLKDTSCVIIASIDMRKQAFSTIAYWEGLPFDSDRLIPLPVNMKGLLVLSNNAIIHLEPGSPGHGLSVNAFTERMTTFRMQSKSTVSIPTLHGCVLTCHSNALLLITQPGMLFSIIINKTGRTVRSIECKQLEPDQHITNNPTCILSLDDKHVFVGSSSADAKLLHITLSAPTTEMDIDEDELYGGGMSMKFDKAHVTTKNTITLLDTLPCLSSSDMVKVGGTIVLASGQGRECRVEVLHAKLALPSIASFSIPGGQRLFPLSVAHASFASYLLISTDTASMLMKSSGEGQLDEVEESGFYLEGATLFAGSIDNLFVQVHQAGIRTIDAASLSLINESPLQLLSQIIKVQLAGSFLFILQESGHLCTFSLDEHSFKAFPFTDQDASTFCSMYLLESDTFGGLHAALITDQGSLMMVSLVTGQPVFTCTAFASLPLILSQCTLSPHFTEHLVIDIEGMSVHGEDYLVVLCKTSNASLFIYRWEGKGEFHLIQSQLCIAPERLLKVTKDTLLVSGREVSYLVHVGQRRFPRIHCLALPICALVSFPIPTNPHGMIVCERGGRIAMSSLPSTILLDHDTAVQRCAFLGLPPGSRIQHIVHLNDAYAMTITTPTPFTLPLDEHAPLSDNQHYSSPSHAPDAMTVSYKLVLVSPLTWSIVDEYELNEHEHVTCMQACSLQTKQTITGRKHFLVLGTALVKSEDRPSRGRLLVFDVLSVVPQEDRPETNRKLKLLRSEPVRGPVSAIAPIKGHLMAAIGTKILVHSFENNDTLNGIAFIDANTWIKQVAVVKNFFVIADIRLSISFACFQEDPPKIVILGKDHAPSLHATHCDFLLTASELMILMGDEKDGIHSFSYDPLQPQSQGGDKLTERGSLRMPSTITCFKRIEHLDTRLESSNEATILNTKKQASTLELSLLFQTSDASIHVITPIADKQAFRKLFLLQSKIAGQTCSFAGLHPQQSKQSSMVALRPLPLAKHILDYTFIKEFWLNPRLVACDTSIEDYGSLVEDETLLINPDNLDEMDVKGIIVGAQIARQVHAKQLGMEIESLDVDMQMILNKFDELFSE